MKFFARLLSAIAALVLLIAVIPATAQTTILVGVGSTVPQPLYNSWAENFNRVDSKVQVKYLGLGTSEGIAQVAKGNGDFGAGEVRLSTAELHKEGLTLVPVAIVGIVPIYNVPGVRGDLQFSADVLANIFLGNIKNWNDPRIAKLNPSAKLPDLAIKVVHRPDGKGSNFIFTSFLAKGSTEFKDKVGVSASPKWPVGTKAERSSDMVEMVKQASGAIGYVEHSYAVKNNVEYGDVKNAAGQFVKASRTSLQSAASHLAGGTSDEFADDLTATTAKDAYPVASFTWMYVRVKSTDATRASALNRLMTWIMSDGQPMADHEGYVAIPTALQGRIVKKVNSLH
jgi:phosphate transport system substrate-binding protein